MQIRCATSGDLKGCLDLDRLIFGSGQRKDFLEDRIQQGRMYIAELEDQIVGFIAFETEWFGNVYVSLVCVHPEQRRRGIARRLYQQVETHCRNGKLFSSTDENNDISIKMHEAIGFRRSGYIENLEEGEREIIYFKMVGPKGT